MGIEKHSVMKIERSTIEPKVIDEVKKPDNPPAHVEPKASIPGVTEKEEKETPTAKVKKDSTIMGEFRALNKKFESRNSLTVAELTDLKNDLTALRDKIFSKRLEDEFIEEMNKIADMRFFVNDLLIIKSKKR